MSVAFPTSTQATGDGGGGSSVTLSVSPPASLASGDTWLIVAVLDHAGSTIATPTGFTAVHAQTNGDVSYPGVKTFYKIAGSSESAVNVVGSGGQNFVLWCASVRATGAHATSPIGNVTATALSGNSTTADAADVTIQNAGSGALVIFGGSEFDSTAAFTITNPSGTTGLQQRATTSCFPAASVCYELRNAGSYTPGNFTFGGGAGGVAEGRVVVTVEILPPATGNVSANPTGVAGTGSAGSVSTTIAKPVSGVSAAAAIGALAAIMGQTLTGVSGTGQAGSLTTTRTGSVSVTGVSGSGSPGTVTAQSSGANAFPSGVAGTGSAAALGPVLTQVSIQGVNGTGSGGTLSTAISANASVTGVSGSGSAGSVSTSGQRNQSISGNAASGQTGSLLTQISKSISGNEAAGSAGTILSTLSLTLGGNASVAQVGSLMANAALSQALTGISATGQVGTLLADAGIRQNLTGVFSSAQVGSISINQAGSVALVGSFGSGQAGVLSGNNGGILESVQASVTLGSVYEVPIIDPSDETLITINWSALLGSLELGAVQHILPPPLEKLSEVTDTQTGTSQVKVRGGIHGGNYVIQAQSTLSNGEVINRQIPVRCFNS